MEKKATKKEDMCCQKGMCWHSEKSSGAVYGLGFLGAAIYYISTATGFWMGVLGVLKALIWPAIIVYEILKYLGL